MLNCCKINPRYYCNKCGFSLCGEPDRTHPRQFRSISARIHPINNGTHLVNNLPTWSWCLTTAYGRGTYR